MQKLLSYTRKAIDTYNMIENNDSIAVGVSGGKDSLALLASLAHLKNFYPKNFTLKAITIDMGYENSDFSNITNFCKDVGCEHIIEKTQIKQIVFDHRNEKNPCSLCANLRRGALNNVALSAGCNTVALGHHYDDVIETFMMSLLYEGRLNCFSPVTNLEKCNIKIIRPLLFTPEYYIRSFQKKHSLPVFKNPCPADKVTKREHVKKLLETISQSDSEIKKRIFSAVRSLPDWKTE